MPKIPEDLKVGDWVKHKKTLQMQVRRMPEFHSRIQKKEPPTQRW